MEAVRLQPNDGLFLAYFTAASYEEFERQAAALVPAGSTVFEMLRAVPAMDVQGLLACLEHLKKPEDAELRSVLLVKFASRPAYVLRPSDYSRLIERLESSGLASELDVLAFRAAECWFAFDRGDTEEAVSTVDGALSVLRRHRNTPYGDLLRYAFQLRKSEFAAYLGELHSAHNALEDCLGICQRWGFRLLALLVKQQLASLLWVSGQSEQALALHRDPACRAMARDSRSVLWRFHSHTSAAKCAIDCQQTDVAEEELEQAENALAEAKDHRSPLGPGYLMLFRGEIALQRGHTDRALDLIQRAAAYFESLRPPFNRGAFMARIALAEFPLHRGEFAAFRKIERALLREADERGAAFARSRLLLLECYPFATDDPPPRKVFDRVLNRVHLISNPACRFMALSFLFSYALAGLDEREQAFLLGRIRGLKASLDRNCYDSLYREYVSSHCDSAIENRLTSLLDEEEGSLPPDGPTVDPHER